MDHKGVTERFEESDRHQQNEENVVASMQYRHIQAFGGELALNENSEEAGRECLAMVEDMEQQYDALWRVLGGYDGESHTASREIILEKEKVIGGRTGTVSATITPGIYTPAGERTDGGWGVSVSFNDDEDENHWYTEREEGPWVTHFCEKIQHNAGQGYYPFYSWSSYWSHEKIARAKTYLEDALPRYKATLQWLREAASDLELNPDVAEQVQAHGEELLTTT